jgi:hypothetical protein
MPHAQSVSRMGALVLSLILVRSQNLVKDSKSFTRSNIVLHGMNQSAFGHDTGTPPLEQTVARLGIELLVSTVG